MKVPRRSFAPRLLVMAAVLVLVALFGAAPSEHQLVLALGAERAHLRHVQLDCLDDAQHSSGGRWWFDASHPAPAKLELDLYAVGDQSRCEIRLGTEARTATEVRRLRLEGERLTLRLEQPVRELARAEGQGPFD